MHSRGYHWDTLRSFDHRLSSKRQNALEKNGALLGHLKSRSELLSLCMNLQAGIHSCQLNTCSSKQPSFLRHYSKWALAYMIKEY